MTAFKALVSFIISQDASELKQCAVLHKAEQGELKMTEVRCVH